MAKPYIPGAFSRDYHRLPAVERDAVNKEVDRRFRAKTGVTRPLNPKARGDLDLRRTWLRIRDEVVDQRELDQLRHDIDVDALTEIPYEMRFSGWTEGAKLLETWFERPPATAPSYSKAVTDLIKMDWVLGFQRAKTAYDSMIKDKVWSNAAAQKRMAAILAPKPKPTGNQSIPFGDLSQPVEIIDQEWVNTRSVTNGLAWDGMTAALGAFALHVAVAGKVSRQSAMYVDVSIEEVGIYVKDSFDFEGDQFLGVWGYRDTPVNNSDFREWRQANHAGGDFRVFSDVKRIKLTPPEAVTVPI